MIVNLLTTALVLCILGVVLLLTLYLTSLIILLFVPWTQAYLVFAHWLRFQKPERLLVPEAYSLRPFSTRNIRILTPDNLLLGAWHILPLNTPKDTLEKIHSVESQSVSDKPTNFCANQLTDDIFEDALRNAKQVVLYFHGQVGDRGKSNRIATYKSIQESMPSAHIITIDCRGYGDSDGFPSELGFRIDSFASWQWVNQRVACEKIILYGHSLGSGIVANLCLQLEEQNIFPLAMVLDAAFTSMPDMMTAYRKIPIVQPFARFPFLLNHFKMRLTDRFETVRAIESIISPLLLIHGQEDGDVLISNSHTLFHTALSARRLNSSKDGFRPIMIKEYDTVDDNRGNIQTDIPPQLGSSTSRNARFPTEGSMRQRFSGGDDVKTIDEDALNQMSNTIGLSESPSPGNNIGNEESSDNCEILIKPLQDDLCKTVQLEFPREGSFEYNQSHQIGFLTVQYAVHNTCMDFSISKEVLGLFLSSVESRRKSYTNGTIVSNKIENNNNNVRAIDLAKILCSGKNGFVDQIEVPEVVV